MAHYDVTIDSVSYSSSSTVTINAGDSMTLKGSYISTVAYGLIALSSNPQTLIGNFPPEAPKDHFHWKTVNSSRNKIYEAISEIVFQTPGTYTFTKGRQTSSKIEQGGVATVIVRPLAPNIPVNIGGTWKNATASIKVSGSWKGVDEAYVNINGTWKKI